MGRYLDLVRRSPMPLNGRVRTGDESDQSDQRGSGEQLLSLSSLMSQSNTLSERAMRTPTGVDMTVPQEPPLAPSSTWAAAGRSSSKSKPALEIAAATKAIKATKPPQDAWSDAEIEGMKSIEPAPVLLPDGRRLHRFRADSIPATVPDHAGALRDQARWHGAVLVADGHDLIVVERWQSTLPLETLRSFKDVAGAIIAFLRGESRARGDRQTGEPHNE
jgi:hypothetical protein